MFHTTDVLKKNDLLYRMVRALHWRESVLLVLLVSGCCKLMRTAAMEVCRREGPVVLAAVDGGGRGWLFLDAIEEKAS